MDVGYSEKKNRLSDEERDKLTELAFEWRTAEQIRFDNVHQGIKRYLEDGGRLDVPRSYRTKEGVPIGKWLGSLRKERQSGSFRYLTEDLIAFLDQYGMNWD